MKILYVSTVSNTINAFLIPHIKMLIEEGHEVDVAFNIKQEVNPEIKKMGCKVHVVSFQRNPLSVDNLKAYKHIKNIVSEGEYDVVHTHTPIASALVRFACRSLEDTRVFYTAHGFHFYDGAPIKNWITFYPVEKYLSRWTDVLITINQEDYKRANSFNAKEVKLVNGVGINLNKFKPQTLSKKNTLREEYEYKPNDFILIYVGELSHRKHQDLLIKIGEKLKNKIPNLKILLVGSGPLQEKYKKQISDCGLESIVELLGFRKDVDNLMSLSDVAVSTSRQEGLPVNIMEAMAVGLPVVCSEVRGNADLIDKGKGGYLVALDNVEDFTSYIEKIYLNKQLRKKFGQYNIEKIRNYSTENAIHKMKDIYFMPLD